MRIIKGLWLSVATLSREQAEDGFPAAARDVLSVIEEPGPSTTVGRGQPPLNDLLTDKLYSFCEKTRQTNAAEVNELQRLKDKIRNLNTARTTSTWVNPFEEWRVARSFPLPIEKIEKKNLEWS